VVLELDKNDLPTYRPWGEVGWAVIILALSILIGLGIAAGTFFLSLEMGGGAWAGSSAFADVFSIIPTQISCIWMVTIRARRVGGGNLVHGLAAGPIPRSRVFIGALAFELVGTAYALIRVLVQPEYAYAFRNHLFGPLVAAYRAGPILATGYLILLTLLAPVSEELFFRGWLWTALRPSWGIWPTALFTGGVWWISHAYYEPRALHFLLLTAVILSLVRHHTGSVRAAIIIHILENARFVLMQTVMLLILQR